MVDRIASKILVAAPTLQPYPSTLLTALQTGGLLHETTPASHLINGVFWESDAKADVLGNPDVTYSQGSFDSNDKTLEHLLAYTSGFHFELARYVVLGTLAGGSLADQQARAAERFEAWESYDVEREIATYLAANDTPITAGAPYSVDDASGVLLAAISQVYPYAPMVLSGRGPSIKALRYGALDLAGAIYVPGSGFGIGDTDTSTMYATGRISLWRTPIEAHVVLDSPKNEVGALVERAYYAVIDGPIYSAVAQLVGD